MNKKWMLLVVVMLCITTFFIFDGHQWLTLDNLKSGQDQFKQWFDSNPLLVMVAYFIFYVCITALSLPGAAILTLAAGALFGFGLGLILVSFASSLGALLAFLVSRYLLQGWVQKQFGQKMNAINKGIKKEGAFYLFTLRLVPIFPFFLINLLMGLTKIKAWMFYWVSQVGMLAGTIVYVNAGTQLGSIESVGDILSVRLLISFALLGFFPLIAKRFVTLIKKKAVYSRWNKPKQFDRNLIVIGAGAGGLVSSYIAAAVKAKVTLIEAHKMGGDCLNYGCVPSKALIKSAKIAQTMRHADLYGIESVIPKVSLKEVMNRVMSIIKQVEPHDSIERYTGLGVEVLNGYACLVDPWTVNIKMNDGTQQKLTSKHMILATGASPLIPNIPGIEDIGYLTSDTMWSYFTEIEHPPEKMIVLGGGPIGCELSQSLQRLGVEITQIEANERLLPREDVDVSLNILDRFRSENINVLLNHKAIRFERRGNEKYLISLNDDKEVSIRFDEILIAIGRQPRLEGYGLDALGIETNRTIVTNDYLETLYPNIFAVGDVAGPYQFTHTAAHQAWYATVNALFGHFKKFKANYQVIPWVTFTDPEVAKVGLNELDAKTQHIPYEVTKYGIDDLDRAITESENHGFVKVLTRPNKDEILGVTIVGSHAGELLAEFVFAMNYGMGLNKILGTIHAYPTWVEANKYAAGEWKKNHAPEKLLKWLEKHHQRRLGKGNKPHAS